MTLRCLPILLILLSILAYSCSSDNAGLVDLPRADRDAQIDIDGDLVDDDDLPTDGDTTVTDGDEAPVDGDDEAADDDEFPTDGDDIPTDGDDIPTDGDDDLPDGDDILTDGDDIPTDGDDEAEAADCPDIPVPDYSCNALQPDTCPGGICLFGMCVGGHHFDDRFIGCGDGFCGDCETPRQCPVDCADPPAMSGRKQYVNNTTITVWVHGFSNQSAADLQQKTYGADRGCPDIFEFMQNVFGIDRPCADTPAGLAAPNHFAMVEYYGLNPVGWMSEADIAEVERYPFDVGETLQLRYATILAKYIRHHLDVSGATHVNLACHSMGCQITRTMIENNMENLAAENRFVRWYTSTGVIAGAQLARLSDNPTIQQLAAAIGLPLNDFVSMNPDNVSVFGATWDHDLWRADNPLFADMIIHQAGATNPNIEEALGIPLLDLNNPGTDPNDGIMFTDDEYFHGMDDAVALRGPGGDLIKPTHTFFYLDHMNMPDSPTSSLIATATLFHSRKVQITLKEFEVYNDRENHALFDGEHGTPPAEIALQSKIWYDPYMQDTHGLTILVHDALLEQRVAQNWVAGSGSLLLPNAVVFSAPILDEMTELKADFQFLEVDWDEHMGVAEWMADRHQQMLRFIGQIPLTDHTFEHRSEYMRAKFEVKVIRMY